MARMGPPNMELLAAGIRAPSSWVPEDERTPAERRVDDLLEEAGREGGTVGLGPCMESTQAWREVGPGIREAGAIIPCAKPAWGPQGPSLRCQEHGGQPIPARGLDALRRLREGEAAVEQPFYDPERLDVTVTDAGRAIRLLETTKYKLVEAMRRFIAEGPADQELDVARLIADVHRVIRPLVPRAEITKIRHVGGGEFVVTLSVDGAAANLLADAIGDLRLAIEEGRIFTIGSNGERQISGIDDLTDTGQIRMSAPMRPDGRGFGKGPAERAGARLFKAWVRRLRRDICRAFGVPSTRQGEG